MSDINQKVNLLRSSLKAKMPYSYPLEQHPIIGKEEYVQKLYFDVLCVVAQYENKDMENQLKFIQRIMAGAGRSEAISEHIKNAMEITEETFEEFLKQCKENALTDIFIVDGLLIACAGGVPNEKQMEFMSEIACVFGMRRNYLEWMTGIVKAILEQDTQEYTKVCQQIPHDEKKHIVPTVICYLKDFVSGVLVDTDDMLWIYSKEKRKIDIKALFPDMKISRKKVVLENVIIDVEGEDNNLLFSSCEEIMIIHSEFRHIGVDMETFGQAKWEDCVFEEINRSVKNRASIFEIQEGKKFEVNKCCFRQFSFQNCSNYDICCFYLKGYKLETVLDACKFTDCHKDGWGDALFIGTENVLSALEIRGSKFIGHSSDYWWVCRSYAANHIVNESNELIGLIDFHD